MKYLITDHSNEGILFVCASLTVANIIKSGLVDAAVRILYPSHSGYNTVTRLALIDNNQHLQLLLQGRVAELPQFAWNPVYMERRRLVRLRIRLVEHLTSCLWSSTLTTKQTVWDGMENNLQFALRDCNPAANIYSDSVQEYALINEISPSNAHREISLEVDNIQSIKMRVYSFQKHFVTKINQVTTEEESTKLYDRMSDIFYRDTFI